MPAFHRHQALVYSMTVHYCTVPQVNRCYAAQVTVHTEIFIFILDRHRQLYTIDAVIVIQSASLRSLVLHDSPQHPHTVAILNEWKSSDAAKRTAFVFGPVPLVWALVRKFQTLGMECSQAIYLYYTKATHKLTHKHSTRFMPSQQWNETPLPYMWIVQKNGNAEANGIKRIMNDVRTL